MTQDVNPAEAQLPGVPHDVEEGDTAGPALSGEHPVSGPGIFSNVAFAPVPDIEAVQSVIKNGNPDPEQLKIKDKRKTGEQLHLFGVGARASGGECVGNEMLNQKRAHRNDAAQRMKFAKQKRMSMSRSQRSDALAGVDGICWTGGCRHDTPYQVGD